MRDLETPAFAQGSALAPRPDIDGAPDAELVGRALAGDAGAAAALLARHRDSLVAVCRRIVGDPFLADDCAQDACLLALINLHRLKAPDQFGPWLRGIGVRAGRRALHARAAEQRCTPAVPADALALLPDDAPAAEDALAASDLSHSLRAAVADLPSGQREAIRLFYLRGLSYEETAAILRIPISALKARLHKARAALRQRLDFAPVRGWDRAAAASSLPPRTLAIHEAGHAVMHVLGGGTINRISIDLADYTRGVSTREHDEGHLLARFPTYDLLTMTMAGEAAELHARRSPRDRPNPGDRPAAARIAFALTGGDPVESALVIDQARRAAQAHLASDRTWRLVERVAAALVSHTVLDGDDFRRLVGR